MTTTAVPAEITLYEALQGSADAAAEALLKVEPCSTTDHLVLLGLRTALLPDHRCGGWSWHQDRPRTMAEAAEAGRSWLGRALPALALAAIRRMPTSRRSIALRAAADAEMAVPWSEENLLAAARM